MRKGGEVAASVEASEGGANLSLEAAERLLQRPVNDEKQREKYSGKRKTHTDKNLLLVNENTRRMVYLSKPVEGKMPDKKLADKSKIRYPKNARRDARHGISRLSTKRSCGATTKKKARKQELTAMDKFLNKMISRVRIVVENVISGVKRCLDCERRVKTNQRRYFGRCNGDCLRSA